MREVETSMPAIAPIEDLRAAQKGLCYRFLASSPLPLAPYDLRFKEVNDAMLHALCPMREVGSD